MTSGRPSLSWRSCWVPPGFKRGEVNIPFVLVMRTCPELTKDAVLNDDYQGAYEAVRHLARSGRRRIGLVSGPMKVSNAKNGGADFATLLKRSNLLTSPNLSSKATIALNPAFALGMRCFHSVPMGVYVANYLMTVGFLKAAEEMGLRCPEDFGLVSFDDYPWLGVFRPRLTTVELPKHQLGSEAAELLIQRIEGDTSSPVVRKLQPELRIRESCGFGLFVSGEHLLSRVSPAFSPIPTLNNC